MCLFPAFSHKTNIFIISLIYAYIEQLMSLLHDKASRVVLNTPTVKIHPNQYTCFSMSNWKGKVEEKGKGLRSH